MAPLNSNLSLAEIDKYWPDLRQGMHSPQCPLLSAQKIYRFSSHRLPEEKQITSPWWFADADFKKLGPYLRLDPTNPGLVARLQGAVCYEWSEMDLLITAELTCATKVFQGPGRIQVEPTKNDSVIIYQPPQDLNQTYIPGLRPGRGRPADPKVRQAIQFITRKRLAGLDAIDRAILKAKGKVVVMPGNPTLH